MPIQRLLIANRGEIAVRIIRAARELGIHTIAAHSSADKDSLAVRLADEAVEIGPAQAAKSYLNAAALLQAAADSRADAVHPGYGFLAENAAFARAVTEAGLVFVGPDAGTIERMGDKAQARATAQAAGVPVVPGSDGVLRDATAAAAAAENIGFPLMIKAAAGGGGKGIRVVENADDFAAAFQAAQREGVGAFGDDGMYLERFIPRARHIEVQILGDGRRAIHLYDRECSLQRRRQKVLEEAPSPALSAEVRERLCASAVALAESVGYCGAGTMEYLYDDESGAFYFIEMNTRIQVEHPVTEMITGVDLVQEQIRVAAGEKLRFRQRDLNFRGHAIECRINAEDPFTFVPFPGKITAYHPPGGPGIRVDSHIYQGYTVPQHYDSMVAKLIAFGDSREQAIRRMRIALSEMSIDGIKTNIALHQELMHDTGFVKGGMNIHYLEKRLAARNEVKRDD